MEALRLASTDERVKGVIATFGANQRYQGLAQIQELRNAVTDFRWAADGAINHCTYLMSLEQLYTVVDDALGCCRKRASGRVMTVAYADAFGEAGIGGTLSYYLASAFEKVNNEDGFVECWLQVVSMM